MGAAGAARSYAELLWSAARRGSPVSVGRGGGKKAGVVTPSMPAPRPR